jgi:hypothetical protein
MSNVDLSALQGLSPADLEIVKALGASQGGADPNQIPGKPQVWKVGSRSYLVYFIPGTQTPMVWEATGDQLKAFYGDAVPAPSRTMTEAEFTKLSPWKAGLASELRNTADDPWTQFFSDYNEASGMRPWLKEPDMLAVLATAYLEGRTPTTDELSKTTWWNTHKAEERAWLEESVTMGSREIQGRKNKATLEVMEQLRQAGVANPEERIASYIAERRVTGQWSDVYTAQQIRKMSDPYAPGKLDGNLEKLLTPVGDKYAYRDTYNPGSEERRVADLFKQHGVSLGQGSTETADERVKRIAKELRSGARSWEDLTKSVQRLAGQNGDTKSRVRAIFADYGVPIAAEGEDEETRLTRIAAEIDSGKRTFGDVIDSIGRLARLATPGRDLTRQGEEKVRSIVTQWLGPTMGSMSPQQLASWAGRMRNDPDAETELVEMLRQQRLAMFPKYTNPNLTYEDIVSPFRNLATNIWGQPVNDETMLVDLANTADYTEAAKRLRQQGLNKNVTKVVQDALGELSGTAMGERVVQSAI